MFFIVKDDSCIAYLDIMFSRDTILKEWTNRRGISRLYDYFAVSDGLHYSNFWQHVDIDEDVNNTTEEDFLI